QPRGEKGPPGSRLCDALKWIEGCALRLEPGREVNGNVFFEMELAERDPQEDAEQADGHARQDIPVWLNQPAAAKQNDGRQANEHDHGWVEPDILFRKRGRDLRKGKVQYEGQYISFHTTQRSPCSASQSRTPPRKAFRLSPMRAPGGRRFRCLAF